MLEKITEFLKLEECQRLLAEDDMNGVITKWLAESGCNVRPLIKFFQEANIDPLQYMTYLPMGYFYHDNTSEVIKLPNNIKMLQHCSIYSCKNLKEIYLPNSVNYMYDEVIYNCPNLTKIYYEGTIQQFLKIRLNAFISGTNDVTIICSDGEIDYNEVT